MGIDFSKFSAEFKAKFEEAVKDKKITAEEFKGFSKADQDLLSSLIAGDSQALGDVVVVRDEIRKNNNTLEFYAGNDKNEGRLDLQPDTLEKYPNASYGYLKDGVVTLYNKNGEVLKNILGQPIKFNYSDVIRPVSEIEDVEGNFEIPEDEDFMRTNRRFAVALIQSMYNRVIQENQQMLQSLGALDVGFWREVMGMGIQWIADLKQDQELITASTLKRIERIESERDNICNSLKDLIDSPEEFADKFSQLVGAPYGNMNFEKLRDLCHNKENEKDSHIRYSKCVEEFKNLYPENNVNKYLDGNFVTQGLDKLSKFCDGVGDIIVMFFMTGGFSALLKEGGAKIATQIGKEIIKDAAKGNYKRVFAQMPKFTNFVKGMTKEKLVQGGVNFTKSAALSSATMSGYESIKTLVNSLTNGEELTVDEIIDRTLEAAKSGAEMGLEMTALQTFAIGPIMNKLSPALSKMTGAAPKVSKLISEGGESGVSMDEIMKIYGDCAKTARGVIATEGLHLGVSLPVMVVGFTGIDSAKEFLTNDNPDTNQIEGYNEAEFKSQLLKQAQSQEERDRISSMGSLELKAEFVKMNFVAQLEGMATIEGVSLAMRRFQAARLAQQNVPQGVPDLLGAKLHTVEKEGKTYYELRNAAGDVLKIDNGSKKVSKFSSVERATAAYTAMCVRLLSDIKCDNKKPVVEDKTSETSSGKFEQSLPKGYVIDYKTKQPIKVNTDKLKVDNLAIFEGKAGTIYITDEFDNMLGTVTYSLMEVNGKKTVQFEGLNSNVEGIRIGSKLIEELINISRNLGAEGRLFATASPMKGVNGKITNIEFYYKLGFRAVDPNIDAAIRSYIEKGEPVPVRLNVFTDIELTGDKLTQNTLQTKKHFFFGSACTVLIDDIKGVKSRTQFEAVQKRYQETKTQLTEEECKAIEVELGGLMGRYAHDLSEEALKEKGLVGKTWEQKSAELEAERLVRVAALEKMCIFALNENTQQLEKLLYNLDVKDTAKVEEIKSRIEKCETEEEKVYFTTLLNNRLNPPIFGECTPDQIAAEVNLLVTHFAYAESAIGQYIKEAKIDEFGTISQRVKSETSTYDKLYNYMKNEAEKAKKKGKPVTVTVMDALTDVRDEYGIRSVTKAGDYTDKPNVRAKLEKAQKASTPEEKRQILLEAAREAAEYQGQDLVTTKTRQMILQANNPKGLEGVRMVNYVSANGVPILSETQLWELYRTAEELGIKKEHIQLIEVKLNEEGVPVAAKDVFTKEVLDSRQYTSKSQNGYTAFQMNFKTKDGDWFEFQSRDEYTNEFAEAEHFIYDILTDKDIIGIHPEVRDLYDQLRMVLDESNMPKEVLKAYRKTYITDYYAYCRAKSVGIDLGEPSLQDYAKKIGKQLGIPDLKLDPRLDARNLMLLHELGERVKKQGKPNGLSTESGMELYKEQVEFNSKIANNPKARAELTLTGKESESGVKDKNRVLTLMEGLSNEVQYEVLKRTNNETIYHVEKILSTLNEYKNITPEVKNQYLLNLFGDNKIFLKDRELELTNAIIDYHEINGFKLSSEEFTEILTADETLRGKYASMLKQGYTFAQAKQLDTMKPFGRERRTMSVIFDLENAQKELGNDVKLDVLKNCDKKAIEFAGHILNLNPENPQEVVNVLSELLPKLSEYDYNRLFEHIQDLPKDKILVRLTEIRNDAGENRVDLKYSFAKTRYCTDENGELNSEKVALLDKIEQTINEKDKELSDKGYNILEMENIESLTKALVEGGKFNAEYVDYACEVIKNSGIDDVMTILNYMSAEDYNDFSVRHKDSFDTLDTMIRAGIKYDRAEADFIVELKDAIKENNHNARFYSENAQVAHLIYTIPEFKENAAIDDMVDLIDKDQLSVMGIIQLHKIIKGKNIKCQNIVSLATLMETKPDRVPELLTLIENTDCQNKGIEVDVEKNQIRIGDFGEPQNTYAKVIKRVKLDTNTETYDIDSLHKINSKSVKGSATTLKFGKSEDSEVILGVKTRTVEHDYRTNTVIDSTVQGNTLSLSMKIKEQKIQHLDENGNLLYTEVWESSKTKKNSFNIYEEYPDGRKIIISTVEKTPAGEIVIEKTLESSDGTKTNYAYVEDPSGASSLRNYEIKDKDSNILSHVQSLKYYDSDHYDTKTQTIKYDAKTKKTTIIDNRYHVDFENDTFTLTDKNGTKLEIKIDDLVNGSRSDKRYFAKILKKIPAEDLVLMKAMGIKLEYSIKYIGNACYEGKTIKFGPSVKNIDRVFVFLHEFNHAKDHNLNNTAYKELGITNSNYLSYEDEFKAIHQSELDALRKNAPSVYEKYLNYFITPENKDEAQRPFQEMIAEAGAIQNTDLSNSLSYRTQLLQKYFPKTIAYLTQRIADTQTKIVEHVFETQGTKSKGKSEINRPYDTEKPLKEQYPDFYKKLEAKFAGSKSDMSKTIDTLLKCYAHDAEMTEYLVFEVGMDARTTGRMASLVAHGHKDAYIKMRDSGLFELIRDGKLDKEILDDVRNNSYFSDALLSDIAKMRDGKGVVTTLPNGAKPSDIAEYIPSGDVAEINGKLYANNNGTPVEIKLTKEKFEELFPPVKRFYATQGKLGDCWFVSTLSAFMDSPDGRIKLYELFSQGGNDILVQFPNTKQVVRFEGGKPADVGNTRVFGVDGFTLIEQAYVIERHNKYKVGHRDTNAKILEEHQDWFESNIEGGYNEYAVFKIVGFPTGFFSVIRSRNFWREMGDAFSWREIKATFEQDAKLKKAQREKQKRFIEQYANDRSKIFYVAMKAGDNAWTEEMISFDYDLYTNHAYAVKGYNKETGMVKITNPWSCGIVTEVPIDYLLDNIQYWGCQNLDGTHVIR